MSYADRALKTSEALSKMATDGYFLCSSHGGGAPAIWLQQRPGCGGEIFNVRADSFGALVDRQIIRPARNQKRFGVMLSTLVWELVE